MEEMVRMELSDEELDAVAGGKSSSRDDSYYHTTAIYTCVGISVSNGKYSFKGTELDRDTATKLAYYLRSENPCVDNMSIEKIQSNAFDYVSKNWDAFAADRKHQNGG